MAKQGRPGNPVDEESLKAAFNAGAGVKTLAWEHKIGVRRLREILGLTSEPSPDLRNGTEEADAAPETWTVSIDIPTKRLDAILSEATGDELMALVMADSPAGKASAVGFLLQHRMNNLTKEAVPDGTTQA